MGSHEDDITPEQRFLRAIFGKPSKNTDHPCPTEDCPGDARYAPPGRGHDPDCGYMRPPPGEATP